MQILVMVNDQKLSNTAGTPVAYAEAEPARPSEEHRDRGEIVAARRAHALRAVR